jgi:hypothetical protein
MMKIRALRQFSHYHAGNFDQFEVRNVTEEIAEQLIGLELAEEVESEQDSNLQALDTPADKKKAK